MLMKFYSGFDYLRSPTSVITLVYKNDRFLRVQTHKIHNEDLIVFTLLKAENVTYYIFKLIVMLHLK